MSFHRHKGITHTLVMYDMSPRNARNVLKVLILLKSKRLGRWRWLGFPDINKAQWQNISITKKCSIHSWAVFDSVPSRKRVFFPFFSRCCSRLSIIMAQQCWGMLRWAWLKPRMPLDLLWRKWAQREDSRAPFPSISLLLYSCAIWFTGFCTGIPLHKLHCTAGAAELCMSHYVFHNVFLSFPLCVNKCAWRNNLQSSVHRICIFKMKQNNWMPKLK